jgi:hypothetical protein
VIRNEPGGVLILSCARSNNVFWRKFKGGQHSHRQKRLALAIWNVQVARVDSQDAVQEVRAARYGAGEGTGGRATGPEWRYSVGTW